MMASTQTSGDSGEDDPLIGRVLDQRYRLLRRLGEGGMGLVYEAKHEILGGRLAVKVLRSEASQDEESIERLKREAQSASAIGSDHIVDVRDFGRIPDGSTYVVMELIEGVDLFKEIHRAPLEWKRARHVALQICDALGAAHDGGIVHRDLKPENVLLTTWRGRADFVKIVDFGIAKMEGSAKITVAGRVMGTPEYMSPEQCSGIDVDHRTDIYSLGVLMYEMVTGQLPFSSRDLAALVRMQIKDPPPPPARVRPEAKLPADFESIVLGCLMKHSDDRYQSMAEVAEVLRAIDETVLAETGAATGRRPTAREAAATQVFVEDADGAALDGTAPDGTALDGTALDGTALDGAAPDAPPPTRDAMESAEAIDARPVSSTGPVATGPSPTGDIGVTRSGAPVWVWALGGIGLALGIGFGLAMMGPASEPTSEPTTAAIGASDPPPVSTRAPTPTPDRAAAPDREAAGPEEASPAQVAPAEPDPGEAVPASPGRAFVTIESDPSPAQVYRDGALVGETPLSLMRPRSGERLELSLRAAGYRDHEVVLGPLTAEQLRVVLARAPRGGSRPPEEPTSAVVAPEPPPPPADPRHREFRDPWNR